MSYLAYHQTEVMKCIIVEVRKFDIIVYYVKNVVKTKSNFMSGFIAICKLNMTKICSKSSVEMKL